MTIEVEPGTALYRTPLGVVRLHQDEVEFYTEQPCVPFTEGPTKEEKMRLATKGA